MTNAVPEAVETQFMSAELIARWPAGKTLFREGEQPRGVFMIHSGEVELVFSGKNGNSKALRVAHAGTAVGLGDAVANTPHDCTATTHTAARIGFVPMADFSRMLNESPSLWLKILQYLSEDVNACWESMRTMSAR